MEGIIFLLIIFLDDVNVVSVGYYNLVVFVYCIWKYIFVFVFYLMVYVFVL